MKKMALLIVDVQEAFIGNRKKEKNYKDTFEYINYTSELFRAAGAPVVIVRDIESGDGEEYVNVQDLIVKEGDAEVLKTFNNAFWETDLDALLKKHEVEFVVVCGNAAEFCILSTYNGARERGYGAAMLQNGIFAAHPEGLLDIVRNRSLISYGVLDAIFN